MLQTISNTSPLLYLYRIGLIDRLPEIFGEIWTPEAVKVELMVGDKSGYDRSKPVRFFMDQDHKPKSTAL